MSSDAPLSGLKVLDLSRVLAGPWCTQTLADLGADVWKVEAIDGGDDTRSWFPPERDGLSTYFMCCNRSKKSIPIDLKKRSGREIALRLASKADVLVENFRTGALDRLGLGYDALADFNPQLIYCSISGYGRSGIRSHEAGYDLLIQAESGLMAVSGEPNGSPMKLGVPISDLTAGMAAVQAILAALIARQRDSLGQHIDISLLDTSVTLLANVASGWLNADYRPERFGNCHPTVVPYQLFRTADGPIVIAVGNDRQFRSLCERVLDRPEIAKSSKFLTNKDRLNNRVELIELLETALASRNRETWVRKLKEAGIPAGVTRTVQEALSAPEIIEKTIIHEIPTDRHGVVHLTGSPLHLSRTPARAPMPPPALGEHTVDILQSVLGATAEEIRQWRDERAIA